MMARKVTLTPQQVAAAQASNAAPAPTSVDGDVHMLRMLIADMRKEIDEIKIWRRKLSDTFSGKV